MKKQKQNNQPTKQAHISLARKAEDEGNSLEDRQKCISRNVWFFFL